MPCLGTTFADVDTRLIKREFLPKAVAEDVLAEDKRPLEDQLRGNGMRPRMLYLSLKIDSNEYKSRIESRTFV